MYLFIMHVMTTIFGNRSPFCCLTSFVRQMLNFYETYNNKSCGNTTFTKTDSNLKEFTYSLLSFVNRTLQKRHARATEKNNQQQSIK